jgi:hypothetical protein
MSPLISRHDANQYEVFTSYDVLNFCFIASRIQPTNHQTRCVIMEGQTLTGVWGQRVMGESPQPQRLAIHGVPPPVTSRRKMKLRWQDVAVGVSEQLSIQHTWHNSTDK